MWKGLSVQTITKADLTKLLADEMNCQTTTAKQAVDILFETLADAIMEGERIEIRGFGSWDVKRTNVRAIPEQVTKFLYPPAAKWASNPAKSSETPSQHPSQTSNDEPPSQTKNTAADLLRYFA